MILGLCERFGCMPDQAESMDVRYLRMIRIQAEATPEEGSDHGE